MGFLVDRFPPQARKYIYLAASLFAFGYAAWQAHGGDWLQTVLWLATSAAPNSLAHANTSPEPDTAPPAGQ